MMLSTALPRCCRSCRAFPSGVQRPRASRDHQPLRRSRPRLWQGDRGPHAPARAEEFRRFLNLIDNNVPPDLDVHDIVDNSSTHKTLAIQRWHVRHPRFTVHFTPI